MANRNAIHGFFRGDGQVDLPGLSAWLDALSHDERVGAVRELSSREQARLFEAAKGHRPLSLSDFVPESCGELREVVHHGRNSLPTFRLFEKRFCRPGPHAKDRLYGYNEQAFGWFTGPGFFVTREARDGELVIDYLEWPGGDEPLPFGWPRVRPNSAGFSRFVYHGTRDFMRGVSAHVSIGRASRDKKSPHEPGPRKWMDNWFVLCRE